MKDEKEVLTRQTIFQKLIRECKRSMVGAVLMLFFGALIFGMQYLLVIGSLPTVPPAVKVIETVFIVGFVGVCAFFFLRAVLRLGKARREEFLVVEDRLENMYDERPNILRMLLTGRISNPSNYDHVFKFESGRKFTVNCGEIRNSRLDTVAKFSLAGDVFYLVCYKNSPEKIVWLYASKIYDYKDLLDETLPK